MSEIQNVIDGLRLLLDEVPEKLAGISEEGSAISLRLGNGARKRFLATYATAVLTTSSASSAWNMKTNPSSFTSKTSG
jgi:hypothetical protein